MSEPVLKNQPKSVGVAIIWNNHILLVHHPKSKKFKGTLSIPKGRQEENEIGAEILTAIREVKEEVGIDVPFNWLMDKKIHSVFNSEGREIQFYVVHIKQLKVVNMVNPIVPPHQYQRKEVDWAGFMPFEEAWEAIIGYQRPILIAAGFEPPVQELKDKGDKHTVEELKERTEMFLGGEVQSHSLDIEKDTIENDYYRKVIYTFKESQLVLMSIDPLDEIGVESHRDNDQFIRVESGKGVAIVSGKKTMLKNGIAIGIPKGSIHNIINISHDEPLKLYTVYSPPVHAPNTIEKTKSDEKPENEIPVAEVEFEEGGIIEGQLHSECNDEEGCGEKFDVGDGGRVIEAERDEAVIVSEAFEINNCPIGGCSYSIQGTCSQIASALNVIGGGKSFDEGAEVIQGSEEAKEAVENTPESSDTDVERKIEGGSIIINRRSMADPKIYLVTGTPRQIASLINSVNDNGVVIEQGGTIKEV